MNDETFGPVAPVCVVKSFDEALMLANRSRYGLGATMYTTNLDESMRAVNELEAGMVWVNAPLLDNDAGPFGGRKQSGMGRQLGAEGLDTFRHTKLAMIDRCAKRTISGGFRMPMRRHFRANVLTEPGAAGARSAHCGIGAGAAALRWPANRLRISIRAAGLDDPVWQSSSRPILLIVGWRAVTSPANLLADESAWPLLPAERTWGACATHPDARDDHGGDVALFDRRVGGQLPRLHQGRRWRSPRGA